MEAGIFSNDFAKPRNESVDPAWSKYPNQILDLFDRHCSNRRYSIFQIVKEQRLDVLNKKLLILYNQSCTCVLIASSIMCFMSSSLTLHLLSYEQDFRLG